MQKGFRNRAAAACAALIATAFALAPGHAVAMTAEEAFADGNRLFREDLYWAALLRYQQAADSGMNSALLHYNVGVAHYKARQYERAIAALERAAQSPRLAVLAHYNLGLAHYAAGEKAAALRWFRKAQAQERSQEVRKLADRAIERIRRDAFETGPEPESVVEEEPLRELERKPRPFSNIEFFARAGFGSDDNVYRSPAEPYVDLTDPDNPQQVDPIVQSGTFTDYRVGALWLINSFEHESFFARLRARGRIYPDALLSNADEHTQELAFGTEFRKLRENRQNRMFSAFTIAYHDETFFDPDNGEIPVINDVEIFNRYSYLRFGPEIRTRQAWKRLAFELWGKAQLWNYENALEVPEYDHEYFRVGGHLQYRFTKTSLLRLTAEGYMRNFGDRPSFELDGTQPIGVPTVEYTYVDYGITARQRLTGGLWFGVKYVFTDRRDRHVGYNDYTRDGFGAELHLRLGERFTLNAEALYRIYDFTNAFAYHDPGSERKTLETADGRLGISYELPWNLRLIGDYSYKDVTSNDARLAHERNLFSLSLQWTHE